MCWFKPWQKTTWRDRRLGLRQGVLADSILALSYCIFSGRGIGLGGHLFAQGRYVGRIAALRGKTADGCDGPEA
jgi:hypothetical protein